MTGPSIGDAAPRGHTADPDLLARLSCGSGLASTWVSVTRHPLDNLATLGLRRRECCAEAARLPVAARDFLQVHADDF